MIKRICLFALLSICISCSKKEELNVHGGEVLILRNTYGKTAWNGIDIYIYTNETDLVVYNRPMILFVHGGGWHSQDKDMWWSREKAEFFGRNGFISATINFALSPYPLELDNPDRVKHPVHVKDVARAVAWLVNHAGIFGGDPKSVFLMGHSSGAHLVDLAATNERFLEEEGLSLQNIKGIISVDGGAYMTNNDMLENYNGPNEAYFQELYLTYRNAIGDDPADRTDACPVYHITPGKNIPPFLLIYDSATPYRTQANEEFATTLERNGYLVIKRPVEGYEHSEMMIRIGTSEEPRGLNGAIVQFLSSIIQN